MVTAENGTAAEPPAPEPHIEQFENGWTLVTAGSWQISVMPDGLLSLPRHLIPAEVEDFCIAARAAAVEGAAKVAANRENETPLDMDALPSSAAMVTEGPPPPGYTPMVVREGPNQAPRPTASISRRTRNPRAPRAAMPGVSQQPRRR